MARFDTIFPFSRLRKGKFRNTSFFILKDKSTSGGRKVVVHEYVNSDTRFVEDLGKLKRTFSMEIYVDTNENFNARENLIKDLDTKGIGVLVHPFQGKKNVSVLGWTAIDEYGWTKFDVTFAESDPAVYPAKEKGHKSILERLKGQISSLQETKIGAVFDVAKGGYKLFQKGVEKTNQFSEEVLEVSNAAMNLTSEVGTLQNTIFDTLDNVALIIKTPATLGARIKNIFTQFALIGETAKNRFDDAKALFGFGDDDTDTKTDTVIQRRIKANNDVINVAVRANAFALAAENSADIDYNNDEEVENIKNILENEYQGLVDVADDDTIELLKQLKGETELVLEQLSKSVPKVYTVEIKSYQNIHQIVNDYYGNFSNYEDFEDRVNEIWALNSFTNPLKIRGTVKLLTI